ncbi:MAG: protein kinase, partial [Nanoarchaeota archaeon]
MVNTQFIDEIRAQLQTRGYTLGERLGANADAQTFTFLADFTDGSITEKRVVKLKSLLTVSAGDNGLEKRLEQEKREIDILETVQHPRIPAVREHLTIQYQGVLQVDVLALQYLKMPNLGQRMQQGALLSETEAVALLCDSLDALAHVHAKGIYHRDIKPSNLLFDGKAAYIIDFNFSKVGNEGSSTVINTYGYYPVDSYSGNIHHS